MPSPVKLYHQEMQKNLGFFATWLPGDLMRLGDIGVLRDGRFEKQGSLKEIGIAFAVAKAGAVQDVSYSAAAEKRIAASADAEAAAFARTNIHLRFSSEGGFIFDALGMQPLEFKEPMKMAESIVGAYERNRWKKEWLLVDTVYTASLQLLL